MKRVLLSALTLMLAISVAGCGGGGGTSGGGDGGSPSSGGADEIATIEEFAAAFERDYGGEAWYAEITGITLETMLGTPVIVVRVSYANPPSDWDPVNVAYQGISDALGSIRQSIAPNAVFMFADGSFMESYASTHAPFAPMNEVFSLPPAPQTPEEVRQWLAAVYGPGGLVALGPNETWYDSITEVTTTDFGSGPVLLIKTSASSYFSTDGSLLEKVVKTTGSPMVGSYSIQAADGTGASGSASVNEPGSAGWLYPTP